MTREEATRVLKHIWNNRDENAKSLQQLTNSFFEGQEAIRIAIAALRDMLKRREGCYACREEQPYCDDSGWWAMYEGDTLRLSAKGDEHCIASPFCINCGRQLAKEGGDETKSVEVEG